LFVFVAPVGSKLFSSGVALLENGSAYAAIQSFDAFVDWCNIWELFPGWI
jgi:hypothetical protein